MRRASNPTKRGTMKRAATAIAAIAAIAAAGCGTTAHHAASHNAQRVTITRTTTASTTPAACRILRGDWDRTRAHVQRGEFAYAGGAWFDIAKDFQALGMPKDYSASRSVASILIDVSEGQSMTSQQQQVLTGAVKQINTDGSVKCDGDL